MPQVTATYDPGSNAVSEANISNTNHDMFCPGISVRLSSSNPGCTEGAVPEAGCHTHTQASFHAPASNVGIATIECMIRISASYSAACSL